MQQIVACHNLILSSPCQVTSAVFVVSGTVSSSGGMHLSILI